MRHLKDENCVVVEKKILLATQEKTFIKDNKTSVFPAQPERYCVKVLGGVSYTDEVGYEDSYLQSCMVDKTKFDLTNVNQKVIASYDYGTDGYKDKFINFSYEFCNK